MNYGGTGIYIARVLAVIAVVYLVTFLHSNKRVVFGILFAAGALMLATSVEILSHGWVSYRYEHLWGFVPLRFRFAAFAILLLAGVAGWIINKQSAVPVLVVAGVAWALPWAQKTVVEDFGTNHWTHSEPSLLAYILLAGTAVFLAGWGVRILAKSLVNFGVVAFAATVIWFYFSSVMDKLGRSLGLIMLGVLFLAGGWALERMRRKLVSGIKEAA